MSRFISRNDLIQAHLDSKEFQEKYSEETKQAVALLKDYSQVVAIWNDFAQQMDLLNPAVFPSGPLNAYVLSADMPKDAGVVRVRFLLRLMPIGWVLVEPEDWITYVLGNHADQLAEVFYQELNRSIQHVVEMEDSRPQLAFPVYIYREYYGAPQLVDTLEQEVSAGEEVS